MDIIFALSATAAVVIVNVAMGFVLRNHVKVYQNKPGSRFRFIAIILIFTGLLCFIVTITQHKLPLQKEKVVRVENKDNRELILLLERLLMLKTIVIKIKA